VKLAAIVYSTDHDFYVAMALHYLTDVSDPELTEIVVIDNGSSLAFSEFSWKGDRNIRYEQNIGGNAVFHRWLEDNWFDDDLPDYLAFLHCDLMVRERGWDERVIAAFEADPKLDLIGFVGSNKIDHLGGRGDGTMLNYIGAFYDGIGSGSPAEYHGERIRDLRPAAVVDHCAMIFRRETLQQLTPQEGTYAPEHFYDRILSCEVLQRGGHIAVLGIECDHFSGGIGPGMAKAELLRKRWLEQEGISYDPQDSYSAVYLESEKRFFSAFKGFFPLRVNAHYEVQHG
jgi:hypothetical protein